MALGILMSFPTFIAMLRIYTDDMQKERIQAAFINPFEGGGSYVSLYDTLMKIQPQNNRLAVGGIVYHSPGYITLRGSQKSFDEIRNLLSNFETNSIGIEKSYKALYKTLGENNLRRLDAGKFKPSKDLSNKISSQSKELAELLDLVEYKGILSMSRDNKLIAAKVLLSLYRRTLKLHEFFLEGRVSINSEKAK